MREPRAVATTVLTLALAALATPAATQAAPPPDPGGYEVTTTVNGRTKPAPQPVADENFLTAGQRVAITCQAKGVEAYGSVLWDLVENGGKRLFVPDRFIRTFTDGRAPGVRRCDRYDRTWTSPPPQMLLVHGYGKSTKGKDCNDDQWRNALAYYERFGGRPRSSMTTIGYYPGDRRRCDAMIGDGNASNARPIQDIARDLAIYIDQNYTSHGRSVDIVAHSMGGLVSRVALLGSAQGWKGFPRRKLRVGNVVTLGTPHRGVRNGGKRKTWQWKQMNRGSGFIKALHEPGRRLGKAWARGTDWSFVGSAEDDVVAYHSAIDRGFHADQKYLYPRSADGVSVGHEGIRALYGKRRYRLTYAHASGNHGPHRTTRGWSPLKAAFKAATRKGDGLPR